MNILITGATGFVGSHLIDRLNLSGHNIFSLYRNKSKFKKFNILGTPIKGDFTNFSWIKELPPQLDCVIHTAGIVHSFNEKTFFEINSFYTKELINQLKLTYKNLRFILISSQAACGPTNHKKYISENSEFMPVSNYGKSKLEAEKFLNFLAPKNWDTIILRPSMIIGPRDPAILEIFKMVQKGIVPVAGNPSLKNYSFISVFDFVDIIEKCINFKNPKRGELFFACSPKAQSYADIVLTIKKIMKKKSPLFLRIPSSIIKLMAKFLKIINTICPTFNPRLTPDKVMEILPNNWLMDSSKSVRLLNMNYFWTLEKIIFETYLDYKNRNWI